MTIASQSDLVTAFGSRELVLLTDDPDTPTGAINATKLSNALAWADNLIISKISGRFPPDRWPNPVPARLVDIACDMARYRLYGNQPTDHMRTAYEDAVKQLDAARDGKETLGLSAGDVVQAHGIIVSNRSASDVKTFGPDVLNYY